jgi:uncharacterized protein YvpB
MRDLLTWKQFDAAHGWAAETHTGADGTTTTLLGPPTPASAPFTEAVPSWSAATPPGAWIEVQLRARRGEPWTAFYRIAEWDSLAGGSRRHSFEAQRDADGRVATDTLVLAEPADAIQPRVLLHSTADQPALLRALHIALSGPGAHAVERRGFTPRELPVPPRAQLDYLNGSNICSPTSVAMLLAYWQAQTGDARLAPFAERQAVADLVVPQVYDPVYDGHGNWSFNTAFAASLGLNAYVARFAGLSQLEQWLTAGVPVIISVAWQASALDNAPIPASNGHLQVVCGFDDRGGVIVADPRGDTEAEVRRVYDAAQLEAAWQLNSNGTVYLIYPPDWPGLGDSMA